ncbi:exported protein of unknown function (plasmid) [Cupriavidus taiwanensis]|uniref:Uncharacterized protein n=1 Tax=Cupriavidus taiwanensis TaxID=164546 RepID=A0A375ED18_9BURK|nr:exported protein of unknown function [Cupriavidus taiwanensis]
MIRLTCVATAATAAARKLHSAISVACFVAFWTASYALFAAEIADFTIATVAPESGGTELTRDNPAACGP